LPFPVFTFLLLTSGVPPRALALDSRFFKVSFFSLCSRAGGFAGRAAGFGLRGDGTAGAEEVGGKLGGGPEGVVEREVGGEDAIPSKALGTGD